jgi:hypothetical protein
VRHGGVKPVEDGWSLHIDQYTDRPAGVRLDEPSLARRPTRYCGRRAALLSRTKRIKTAETTALQARELSPRSCAKFIRMLGYGIY